LQYYRQYFFKYRLDIGNTFFQKSIANGIANTFVPKILPRLFSNTFILLDAMIIVKRFNNILSQLLKACVQIDLPNNIKYHNMLEVL